MPHASLAPPSVRAAGDQHRSQVVAQVVIPEVDRQPRHVAGRLAERTLDRPGSELVSPHSLVSRVSRRQRATCADSSWANDAGIGIGIIEVSDFSVSLGYWTWG